MKSDPPTEDGKTVKAAASAWIETAAKHDKPEDGSGDGTTDTPKEQVRFTPGCCRIAHSH